MVEDPKDSMTTSQYTTLNGDKNEEWYAQTVLPKYVSRKQLISLIKMLLDHRVQLMASDLSHYTKPHFILIFCYILN